MIRNNKYVITLQQIANEAYETSLAAMRLGWHDEAIHYQQVSATFYHRAHILLLEIVSPTE